MGQLRSWVAVLWGALLLSSSHCQEFSKEQQRDEAVIRALSRKLLEDPDLRLSFASYKGTNHTLVVAPRIRPFGKMDQSTRDFFATSLQHYTGRKVETSLLDALLNRGATSGKVLTLRSDPKEKRLIITTAEFAFSGGPEPILKFDKVFPNAKAAVSFFLPGYSSDGKTALVYGQVGPAPHGGNISALLTLENDEWKVAWHYLHLYS